MYKLSEITNGQGVNVIIDPIGKNYFAQNIDSMAVDGHMVIIAFMSGKLILRCCFHCHKYPLLYLNFSTHAFNRQCCRKARPQPNFEKETQGKAIV